MHRSKPTRKAKAGKPRTPIYVLVGPVPKGYRVVNPGEFPQVLVPVEFPEGDAGKRMTLKFLEKVWRGE
jgi:hypothetical protein